MASWENLEEIFRFIDRQLFTSSSCGTKDEEELTTLQTHHGHRCRREPVPLSGRALVWSAAVASDRVEARGGGAVEVPTKF